MSQINEPIRVRVDPTNPGQFFACCGLLELADRLWDGAEGWFEDDVHLSFRFIPARPSPNCTASALMKEIERCCRALFLRRLVLRPHAGFGSEERLPAA